MTITHLSSKGLKLRVLKRTLQLRTATLVLVSIVALSGAIVVGWFAGESRISQIFDGLQLLQDNPPLWLLPMATGEYLLFPTVALLLTVLAVMKISPQPRTWSRQFVAGILLALTARYVLWRSLSTLNVADPLNGVFSLGLFFLEMLMLLNCTIQLVLMLKVKDRCCQANPRSVAVINGSFVPNIDILIPTYNEPLFILRRTVIGCQALEYTNKKVYLLDDTRRSEVRQMAEELGCNYITRPDNSYAKAGNLNHALAQTTGQLIVIFDADFIPTTNFLTRTVGFFQEEKVALVQTPQSFYNPDPIAHNLGLENILTPDEEIFYRHLQVMKAAVGSVVCCGTSFIVRRSALEAVGGFVTDSLSEDYFTGICLSARGDRLVYLNEKLSAGLAAENMAAYATQRFRWARGTLQAFFIQANPLTIRGLKPLQRLAHFEGLLSWFTTFSRVGFLLMPLAYSFLGVIPVRATAAELLYFFLPYYLVQLTVFAWLNYRSRSALLADVYSVLLCFPLALTVTQVMLHPFEKGFKVTPKGKVNKHFSFNWGLAAPLIVLFILTAVSLWLNLGICTTAGGWQATVPPEMQTQVKGVGLGWLWSSYNLVVVGIALLILLDVPKPDIYEWFDLRRVVRLRVGRQTYWGITTTISEVGTEVALMPTELPPVAPDKMLPVTIEIEEEGLKLWGQITDIGLSERVPTVRVVFEQVSLSQHRRLVEMLFCRPGQWQRQDTPGEFQSLWLFLKILLRPRVGAKHST